MNRSLLFIILLICVILISGCIFSEGNNRESKIEEITQILESKFPSNMTLKIELKDKGIIVDHDPNPSFGSLKASYEFDSGLIILDIHYNEYGYEDFSFPVETSEKHYLKEKVTYEGTEVLIYGEKLESLEQQPHFILFCKEEKFIYLISGELNEGEEAITEFKLLNFMKGIAINIIRL